MRVRDAIIGISVFLLAGPVWAQTRPAAAPARSEAQTKVAVVNIQSAIGSTDEGKQAAQQYQTKFAPRVSEINDLNNQLASIQKRAQDGANTLSDQEKARLEQQYQRLSRQLQRKQQEYQQDAQDARSDIIDDLGPKMMQVIDRYAREHGYSVVLDNSTQSNTVLYAANNVDITDAVIKLYNQTYPVPKSSTPAKPKPKQ